MLTRLCHYLRPRRHRPQYPNQPSGARLLPATARGQSLVILALAFVVMLLFVGIATDVGSLYFSYAQLKRALDSAAVGMANEFKRTEDIDRMTNVAKEILAMHAIDMLTVDLKVYTCNTVDLETQNKTFYDKCPKTDQGDVARKLVWVEADHKAPLYFMRLLGFSDITLHANAISEAAPIDLVIVFDTSESMGVKSPGYTEDAVDNFDPAACNTDNTCQPLKEAKDAAARLIELVPIEGYDQVGLITFDTIAHPIRNLDDSSPITALPALLRSNTADNPIDLHDDPPFAMVWKNWLSKKGLYNPVNPEDRDGDGDDADPAALGVPCTPTDTRMSTTDINLPCDDDDKLDSYNWSHNGYGPYEESDHSASGSWQTARGLTYMSTISTCTGCGIRVAANMLKDQGRPNGVWVIVLLSDGAVNLSDTYETNDEVPDSLEYGYCGGHIEQPGDPEIPYATDTDATNLWRNNCKRGPQNTQRFCIDPNYDECPSTSIALADPTSGYTQPFSPPYDVQDYAKDMTDDAALRGSDNPKEPVGRDIVIFTIALGVGGEQGATLLRYMADIGEDGIRENGECYLDPIKAADKKLNCGNYYYAPNETQLIPIFENIASRIYTRIAE